MSNDRPTDRADAGDSDSDGLQAILRRLRPKEVTIEGETLWIAEGDVLLDEDQLREYAVQRQILETQARTRAAARTAGLADTGGLRAALVGITSAEKLVRWRDGLILSYCVLRNTFGSDAEYKATVKAMELATGAWERTCGVRFRHRTSLDKSPTAPTSGVVFSVRKFDAGGRFIAAAFFPTDPKNRRRILIDPSFFEASLGFDRTGVLRHELGHVLGFRHEHIRSGAPPSCPDEDLTDTLNLTAYDPQSVMHYFCGGVGSRELAITALDRDGAQRLYGLPLSEYRFVS